jgi:hypothetical protein
MVASYRENIKGGETKMMRGWTLFLTCAVLSFGLILTGCPKKETAEEMAPEAEVEAPAEFEEEEEMMEMEGEMMETEEEPMGHEEEMMEMEEEPMKPN